MTTMTTMTMPNMMTNNDYVFEHDHVSVVGTPRPRRMSDENDGDGDGEVLNPPCARTFDAYYYYSFAKAAKDAAAAVKRRSMSFTRTYYRMAASHQVKAALDELEKRVKAAATATTATATTATTAATAAHPTMMTYTDFQLLKKGIEHFRVRLNVHDNKTYQDIKEIHTQLKIKHQELNANTTPEERADLMYWHAEIMKEVYRIEPKVKYTNIGGGLFRHEFNKTPTDPPGVPSQHAQIAPRCAHALRNILTPETIRRTFISLNSLTNKIREEVATFLRDENREADRAEVIRQIKNEMK
jgi:hypothetical protein